jgi:hypothetical protein
MGQEYQTPEFDMQKLQMTNQVKLEIISDFVGPKID